MTIKGRLARAEGRAATAAGGPLTREQLHEATRQFRRDLARWRGYFVAGTELPPVEYPGGWPGGWEALRSRLVAEACTSARDHGLLPAGGFLPAMGDEERTAADRLTAIFASFDAVAAEQEAAGAVPIAAADQAAWGEDFRARFGVGPDDWLGFYHEAVAARGAT